MKKAIMALAILIAASAATTTAFAHGKTKHKKHATAAKYTCSMHPEVVMSKPGKCPKCGMDLVKMESKKMDKKMDKK